MSWQGDGPPVLGIDLGGTKILVRGDRQRPSHPGPGQADDARPRRGGRRSSRRWSPASTRPSENAGLARQDIAAAGIGSPGPLDTKAGVILFSANLNVKNFPIGPELSAAPGPPRPGAERRPRRRLRRVPARRRPGLPRHHRGVRRHRDRRLRDPGGRDRHRLDRQRRRDRPHHRQGGRTALRLRRAGLHGGAGEQDRHRPTRPEGRAQGPAHRPRRQDGPQGGTPQERRPRRGRRRQGHHRPQGGPPRRPLPRPRARQPDQRPRPRDRHRRRRRRRGAGPPVHRPGPDRGALPGPHRPRRPRSASSAPPWATTPASSARPSWPARSSSIPDPVPRSRTRSTHRPSMRSPAGWRWFGQSRATRRPTAHLASP